MAIGARKKFSNANLLKLSKVASSTIGVSGPTAVGNNEVETVYVAVASKFGVRVIKRNFNGERDQIASYKIQIQKYSMTALS